MIWIATIFLLLVAAWLFFNGLNEKRWVDAHDHDETVASDQGLFAGLAASGDKIKERVTGNGNSQKQD